MCGPTWSRWWPTTATTCSGLERLDGGEHVADHAAAGDRVQDLPVLDLIRVPPPAASTITVRSLDMRSNLTSAAPRLRPSSSGLIDPEHVRVTVNLETALRRLPPRSVRRASVPLRSAGPTLSLHSPVGLPAGPA